jgi:lipoprotein-releasing system ATP-binding protein
MMPALVGGIKKPAAREKAAELLDRVGLLDRAEHFPSQLSGGERQRAALARALINDPPLILADEPTGNLDERNSRIVEEILFDLTGGLNKTLLLVTHDLTLADKGSRHIHLSGGGVREL